MSKAKSAPTSDLELSDYWHSNADVTTSALGSVTYWRWHRLHQSTCQL